MNKTSGRWIIIFVTVALLALVYSHLLGRPAAENPALAGTPTHKAACTNRSMFAHDAPRVTPDKVTVSGSEVELQFHIEAKAMGSLDLRTIHGPINVRLDDGPILSFDASPYVDIGIVKLKYSALTFGDHKIEIGFFFQGNLVSYLDTCVSIPSNVTITHWE
jgi:hypothetical protein